MARNGQSVATSEADHPAPGARSRRSGRFARWRAERRTDDSGAALVEFALVFPILMMLLVGIFTVAVAWNQDIQLSHSTREGARYGATIPHDAVFSDGGRWANKVRERVIERAAGELDDAEVCVALVEDSPPTPVDDRDGNAITTEGDGSACYDDSDSGETGWRVQVTAETPGEIDIIFARWEVTLQAHASARHERSVVQ